MEHKTLRKYRGPETWALVREAYLRGEPGPALARRFDVGLGNLRRKAKLEGWTRRQHAIATDAAGVRHMAQALTPADIEGLDGGPDTALRIALKLAADAITCGRSADAAAILRAAGNLAKLAVLTTPPAPKPRPPSEEELAAARQAKEREREEAEAKIQAEALKLAREMLSDEPLGIGACHSAAAFHWRAQHLGPEVAAADFARGVQGGWAERYWDEHGNLWPLPEPRPPEPLMVRQHQRFCAEKREREEG